jgi:signal transduction histidine kinase/CheY-like chemotaxis protein
MKTSSARAHERYTEHLATIRQRANRFFVVLLSVEWIACVACALWLSPSTWAGLSRSVHPHVAIAFFFGGLIAAVPIGLCHLRPDQASTRHCVAVAQMLFAGLLVQLTGGRIETHFHYFGSLAFLAFYRDWKVLLSATVVAASEHFLRGVFWPESVYGVLSAGPWRWLEHAGWVAFEDSCLLVGMHQSLGEMRVISERSSNLEETNEVIERQVQERTAQLAEALAGAEAANRAKSEFLANMSHEIRTPMNAVIGMTGLMLDTGLSPDQEEYARTVRDSANGLMAVLNDILDFSKVEAGKLELCEIEFNLRTAMEEVVELFSSSADAKQIELVLALPPTFPETVRGDPGRLKQVLNNLVGNAIKFTETGEVKLELCIRDETDFRIGLRISVHDTGIGIAGDRREAIFESFTQADGSTTRKYGGTGLGLTISKRIVELMGGGISLESAPGAGSVFHVDLGFEKLNPTRAPLSSRLENLRGLHVLVVDDNETNRILLREQLVAWGARCQTVASGAEAVHAMNALLGSDAFGLVLLDMQMPGMSGVQTAAVLKADPRHTQTPLVLLSSVADRGTQEEQRQRGFQAALSKPVRRQQLWDAISEVLDPGCRPRAEPSSNVAPAPPELRGLRVLLAEDNSVNQRVALRILERWGCRAQAVANGVEALREIAREPYDLVLMDCQMPELDGLETTRELRRLERGTDRRLPIVAMTANALLGDREKCLAAGMDGYVTKPIRLPELAKAMLSFADRNRAATAVRDPQAPLPCGPESAAAAAQRSTGARGPRPS